MIESLKKHHLGVVVRPEDIPEIESTYKKEFILDSNQGTRVCMVTQRYMALPVEFIVKEGRAKTYDLGVHHVCYEVKDLAELEKLKNFIKEKKMGYRLTRLEESPTNECNHVMFFLVHKVGVIEVNVLKVN